MYIIKPRRGYEKNKPIVIFIIYVKHWFKCFYESRYKKNYEKAKKAFSIGDYDLINKRLDNYDFENEYEKSNFFARAPEIRGSLRKIGIKENSVLLDALDVVGFIKSKITTDFLSFIIMNINSLIKGYPNSIFDYLIQLDSDKIDYAEKYGEKARENFEKSYEKDKITAVKQILKQILADLPKD